jgi:hypothetical protein
MTISISLYTFFLTITAKIIIATTDAIIIPHKAYSSAIIPYPPAVPGSLVQLLHASIHVFVSVAVFLDSYDSPLDLLL